jgi:hypothetical protein
MPINVRAIPRPTTSFTTSLGCAPSATRTPISCVLAALAAVSPAPACDGTGRT